MTLSRYSTVLGSVALTAVLACSACGSSPAAPTLQSKVQAIFTRTNAELGADKNKNPSTAEKNAKYALAFGRAAGEFQALTYPATAKADAKALVAVLRLMATDASKVAVAAAKNQNVLANVQAMAQINLKLIEAEQKERTVSAALRNDLGLPPETTTTTTAPQPLTTTPTLSTTTTAPHPTTTVPKG